ncbi:S25 ribosomal protein-domain-containing protein [Kalaharituber pfeilii]|nr:S25 ribosomal protein-domain-containing protein [Kalaharituber pfeilii]
MVSVATLPTRIYRAALPQRQCAGGSLVESETDWDFHRNGLGTELEDHGLSRRNGLHDILRLIVKDKANHAVILDKTTQDKLNKDVQTYRLITTAVLVDRLKINGSLARKALQDLEEKGVIKKVVGHSKLSIYTRAVAAAE